MNDRKFEIKDMVEYPQVDPEQFKDPLASRVSWTSISKMASTFCMHRLKQSEITRMQLQSTLILKVSCFVWTVWTFSAIYFSTRIFLEKSNGSLKTEDYVPAIVSFMFLIATVLFIRFARRSIVFDKSFGYFWRGRATAYRLSGGGDDATVVQLTRIHAIQVLSYRRISRDMENTMLSPNYELNLVLHDAKRVHVVRYGCQKHALEDARLLGDFLGVPVWDGTQTESANDAS